MARAYERYWVDGWGNVVGNRGLPDNLPVEIGSLDEIMEHYFVLHREKYGGAEPDGLKEDSMPEKRMDVEELLHIAMMATQINKLAGESQPFPPVEAAELAREIAEEALKRAKALLAQDKVEGEA